MQDLIDDGPRNVSETNIALDALMMELADRLNLDSKVLIHGQEDFLKLSEYQTLFEVDMEICENALDLLISLATQQKTYLEAMVTAKRLERSLPSTISQALTGAETEAFKANELRKRVKKGDFSFFTDNDTKHSTSQTAPDMPSSSIMDLPNAGSSVKGSISEQKRAAQISQPSTTASATLVSAFRVRERPQFSSDAARRVLGEINHKSINKLSSDRKQVYPDKSAMLSTYHLSGERRVDEAKLDGKHISASGGCSLDGSIMDFGENSRQNGLRAYSPVYDIPPQPNFDESEFDSVCEVVPPHVWKNEAGDVQTGSTESATLALRSTDKALSQKGEDCSKAAFESGSAEHASWLSSSYVPRARPKFSSSVGRKFNQD